MNGSSFLPRCRVRAFTLVELLAVIAIIGVLAAIVFTTLGKVRSSARVTKCASNLRQIGVAMHTYASDHKGKFPALENAEGVWSYALTNQGYLPQVNGVFQCPDDPYSPTVPRPRSYVYCSLAMVNASGTPQNYTAADNKVYQQRVATVFRPERTFMITEWHNKNQDAATSNAAFTGWDLVNTKQKATDTVGHPDANRNFLYIDGHVAYLRLDQYQAANKGWLP